MDNQELKLLRKRLQHFYHRQRRSNPTIEGLSGNAVRTMGVIARAHGHVQPCDISEELQMASPNVASALRELEGHGYVLRERNEADGRRVDLLLSPAGRAVAERYRTLRENWLRTVIEGALTPEEQELLLRASVLLERAADWDADDAE